MQNITHDETTTMLTAIREQLFDAVQALDAAERSSDRATALLASLASNVDHEAVSPATAAVFVLIPSLSTFYASCWSAGHELGEARSKYAELQRAIDTVIQAMSVKTEYYSEDFKKKLGDLLRGNLSDSPG